MLRIPITGEAGSEKREVVMFAEGTMRDPVVVGSDCGDLEGWDGGTGSVTCDGVSKHPLEDGVVNIGRVVRVHLELVDAVWGMIWDAGVAVGREQRVVMRVVMVLVARGIGPG